MATADKLVYLDETKDLLREAINASGGALTELDPFREYVDPILWGWLVLAYGGLDLDYINERYRIFDPAYNALVEKPWADIVNNYSAPAGRTYFDSLGVLQTAAAGTPIRAYDPATGEFLGNQVWGSYANSLPNSQTSAANWIVQNVTRESAGLDIFGGSEGIRITDNSVNGFHRMFTDPLIPAGPCTLFACVKAETIPWMELRVYGVGPNASVYINGSTGAVGAYKGSLVSSVEVIAHPSIAGAWLVWIMYAGTAGWSPGYYFGLSNSEKSDDIASYAGSGQSAVLLAGGMWEGMRKQPYINAVGSATTIAAENQIIDGSVFSDFWNPAGGTLFIECSGAINAVALKAAGIEVIVDSASNKKYAVAYTSDPSATSLIIGANLNGYIRRIVYFRKELPASLIARLIA